MTFGEKLKKLRTQNNITQEELADKLYVTRTAVSKWENDRGFPGIDSLKQLSALFGVTIDELISDEDVENSKLLDEKRAKAFRLPAATCLALTFAFAFLTGFVNVWCSVPCVLSTAGFIVCALLSKPAYKRRMQRENAAAYIVSRVAIAAIFLLAAVTLFIELFA